MADASAVQRHAPIAQQAMQSIIHVSDAAANKVASLITEEDNPNLHLRVYITGGGCSGYQYGFTFDEKIQIIERYLKHYWITYDDKVLEKIWTRVLNVPREIFNTVTKIRDFVVWHQLGSYLDLEIWNKIDSWIDIDEWWISPFQKSYLDLLRDAEYPLWVSTIAARLWVEWDFIENDVEPLLMKLWYIVKTPKWRVYVA